MKFRKVIESGIITAALALTSVTTAVSASAAEVDTTGVVGSVLDRASQAASTGVQSVQIIQQNAQAAAEAAEWADKMLVTVDKDSSLNIRKEASADAEVVGKFYAGSGAEVLETGDEWTKVKSGDVEGYVNNAYCVFGEDAHTYAEENCETKATANADGIRVREASNTDAKILDVIDSGASLTVNTDAEEVDGWVSVDCNGTTAYVAADYVDVALNIDDAVSMEEIRAREAAAAQKAAQEAAAQAGNSNSGSDSAAVTTSSEAVSASSSDTQLLAAIIQCEAGGEPYSGQLAVGAVVMNRVKSEDFPNTVTEVVWDNSDGVPQFSPTYDGRINEVAVSDETREAVKQALKGTNYSEGALFFIQKSAAEEHNVKWFEKDLKRLFKYGVHEFYTYK